MSRVVKITAEEKEVRGILRLLDRVPEHCPRIDAVVPLGKVSRRPDYADDPVEGYAILREAVTPLSDAEAEAMRGTWTGPDVERDVIATRMRVLGHKLYDYEDFRDKRLWTPSWGMKRPAFIWADNAAWALNYWLHQPTTPRVEKARMQSWWEYRAWIGHVAAHHSHPGGPTHPLVALLAASMGATETPQGAFADFGLANLGRTADGRLVWYDIHWVGLKPEPIEEVLAPHLPRRSSELSSEPSSESEFPGEVPSAVFVVDEDYTAAIAKLVQGLKREGHVESVRQNYKGTGKERARRQLWVNFTGGGVMDIWFNHTGVSFGGIVKRLPRGQGSGIALPNVPYNGRAPEAVWEDVRGWILAWLGLQEPPARTAPAPNVSVVDKPKSTGNPAGTLHERIAHLLGWTVEATQRNSLPNLREAIRGRPGAEKLVLAIDELIRTGNHIAGEGGSASASSGGCVDVAFDLPSHGTIRVVCDQQGQRDSWSNIFVGRERYGYNGKRWARGMIPPPDILEAVRARGITFFGG